MPDLIPSRRLACRIADRDRGAGGRPLRAVSAKEVASRFGFYTDEAMLHPVGIQRHGTTRVVMTSLKEYERLLRRDRQVLLVKDLDDETLDAILSAEIPAEARALDYLMDDSATD